MASPIRGSEDKSKHAKAKTTETAARSHHEDCGEVGDTGEHGDIGSNAADRGEGGDGDEETKDGVKD